MAHYVHCKLLSRLTMSRAITQKLPYSQCANHFDHLVFLPKIAMNHTVNLAKNNTDT